MRRSLHFSESGRIKTGGFMQEIPKDLEMMYDGDPEQ